MTEQQDPFRKRRLAAIMFTDIKGYTALMQRSEQQAMAMRDKHRKVFQVQTEAHGGQILQYYGDGTLSVFDSTVEAVNCAIAIQLEMRADPAVPLRVGIHSGDIVFTDDDVIGDGVNIASRIESLAVPGSILISDKVFDEIKNHNSLITKYLKSVKLKNVEHPVGVHAIANEGLIVPNPSKLSGKTVQSHDPFKVLTSSGRKVWIPAAIFILLLIAVGYWLRGKWDDRDERIDHKKVVAVVPFEATGEEEYFEEGLAQGLISELSKIDRLQVIDKLTTRFYAGVNFPLVNLKEELPMVDYLVSGTAKRTANMVSVRVDLKISNQEETLWSREYQRDISEIRMLWALVAQDLTSPMGIRVEKGKFTSGDVKPVKPEIYELYLRGTYYLSKETPQDWQTGITYLHQAVDQNPADAFAYAALAEGYNSIGHGPAPSRDVFPKAREAALRAIQLDSTLAEGWAALSHYETYFGWNWERAEMGYQKANQLNPNLAMSHFHRAWYLILFGQKDEAIKEHLLAEELDPFSCLHIAGTGLLYSWVGKYPEAMKKLNKALEAPGFKSTAFAQAWTATTLGDMGRYEEAIEFSKQAGEAVPIWKYIIEGTVTIKAGRIEEGKKIIAELEQMPVTAIGNLSLGFMYALLGDNDNSIKWLSRPEKHGWYPWIRVWPGMGMESLYHDPRFLKLLEEMNLPYPEKLRSDDPPVDA